MCVPEMPQPTPSTVCAEPSGFSLHAVTRTGKPFSATANVPWPAFEPAGDESSMLLDLELRAVPHLKVADCNALHAINSSFWPV